MSFPTLRVTPVARLKAVSTTSTSNADVEAALLKLAQTDREVRAHEQAHMAAAGPHSRGGPTYTFERGPDGRLYAVGGEVAIDASPVPNDPEATLRKADIVRAAALAPAEPSSQDRAVAAQASQMAAEAQAEIQQQRLQAAYSSEDPSSQLISLVA
ncbi:MAG: putative metalloprotease CJM1_0395 family protein [Bryobacteraceae bacterium]